MSRNDGVDVLAVIDVEIARAGYDGSHAGRELGKARAAVAELIAAATSARDQLRDAALLLAEGHQKDADDCEAISDHVDAAIAACRGEA